MKNKKEQHKRSTVISKLFRSSRLVKLCSQLCWTVFAWTPYNLLMIEKGFPSTFLLERNEEQDLRGTHLPEVVLNVDVVYWFHHQKKEKDTNQLIETETNQLYLLFFPTVPPGFFLDF